MCLCVCDRVSLRQIVNLHFFPLHCPFCIHIDDDDAFIWRSSSLMTIVSTLSVLILILLTEIHTFYTHRYIVLFRLLLSILRVIFSSSKKTRKYGHVYESKLCEWSEVKSNSLRRDKQKGKMNVLTLYILANQSNSLEGIWMKPFVLRQNFTHLWAKPKVIFF